MNTRFFTVFWSSIRIRAAFIVISADAAAATLEWLLRLLSFSRIKICNGLKPQNSF